MYAPTPISGNRSGHTLPVSAVPMHKTPCRTLLDALPAGILQIAPDESVRFANARFAGMLGYTPDTFPAYLCELIHPDTHFHSQHTWKDLWHTMREFEVPIRFRCKNGHYVATDNLVRLMLDENGQPDFALLVSRPALPDGQSVSHRHLSLSDPLTSLPTRNYLDSFLPDAIARSRKNGKMLALLELNINRFRIVNESLGYDTGDALLRQIASRLVHAVHEDDTVIRAGGDEFIIVLENIGTPADTAAIASRLMQTVTAPMTLAGHPYSVTVSIGASLYPRDATDSRTLLRYADIALAEARKKPTGNIRFFHPGMHVEPAVKLKLESELRRAVEKKRIRPVLPAQTVAENRRNHRYGSPCPVATSKERLAFARHLHPVRRRNRTDRQNRAYRAAKSDPSADAMARSSRHIPDSRIQCFHIRTVYRPSGDIA